MKNVLILAALCVTMTAQAQTKSGGISEKMLQEIEKENVL